MGIEAADGEIGRELLCGWRTGFSWNLVVLERSSRLRGGGRSCGWWDWAGAVLDRLYASLPTKPRLLARSPRSSCEGEAAFSWREKKTSGVGIAESEDPLRPFAACTPNKIPGPLRGLRRRGVVAEGGSGEKLRPQTTTATSSARETMRHGADRTVSQPGEEGSSQGAGGVDSAHGRAEGARRGEKDGRRSERLIKDAQR
ncbi:hypothetical protein KM043_006799 [Ampulex compressa]|nr:hypothetical protein KM043_006799 [Ampulex compressa]